MLENSIRYWRNLGWSDLELFISLYQVTIQAEITLGTKSGIYGGWKESDDQPDFVRHIYSHTIVPNYKHISFFVCGRKEHLQDPEFRFLQCYCCRFCRAWLLLLASDVLIPTTKMWTLHVTSVAFLHLSPSRAPFLSFHHILLIS